MKGPKREGEYDDRDLDCQFQLESSLWELIDLAQEAGWGEAEAANAIIELAMNRILQHDASEEDNAKIADAVEEWRKSHH
ncbi:hypothetical protein HWD97_02655 [Ochrobactrum sp. C6C9]|uniref:hypothetical protein n=1 Tax=Ochrobactrum sp. C6C9 TaxID=2736662 RepID=UPI0035303DFD|nr:hypothetical protein [Ochrobactrum sp. C6C9]